MSAFEENMGLIQEALAVGEKGLRETVEAIDTRELVADLREAAATIRAAVRFGVMDDEFVELAVRLNAHALRRDPDATRPAAPTTAENRQQEILGALAGVAVRHPLVKAADVQFVECDGCRNGARGAAALCNGCKLNRASIFLLKNRIALLERDSGKVGGA